MNYLKSVYLCLVVTAMGMVTTSCEKKEVPVRFAIASDFHAPDVPGGKERVETFIKVASDENVDFIIELGDFCRLDSVNQVYKMYGTVLREKNIMLSEIMTLIVTV